MPTLPFISPIPSSFLLFLLLTLTHHASPTLSISPPLPPTRQAYVSLLYGDFYVLPLRVMMHSLKTNSPDVNSGLRDRLVLVTGDTSFQAIEQLKSDGITVLPVPELTSPYTSDLKFHSRFQFVMTKLTVFNLTSYSRLVFIDADSLILRDMSPLFSCGQFCVCFINPCYFNTGLMVFTPNTSLFSDMIRALPTTPSYDGGDQGFLNAYYPSLLSAPYFDPSKLSISPPPYARLPFSWHVDHSAHFPTNQFEFEKSDRCGSRRMVEWLGPPFTKPWLWKTYAVFDLSWTWYKYRRELHDPYPPGLGTERNGLLLVIACYGFILWMWGNFAKRNAIFGGGVLAKVLRGLEKRLHLGDMKNDDMVAVYAFFLGYALWVGSFFVSLTVVPSILGPYAATMVYFHVRVALTVMVLVLVGGGFCLGKRKGMKSGKGRGLGNGGIQLRRIFWRMVWWGCVDGGFLILFIALLWQYHFATMWGKGRVIIVGALAQMILVGVMLGDVVLVWLRLGDSLALGLGVPSVPE